MVQAEIAANPVFVTHLNHAQSPRPGGIAVWRRSVDKALSGNSFRGKFFTVVGSEGNKRVYGLLPPAAEEKTTTKRKKSRRKAKARLNYVKAFRK